MDFQAAIANYSREFPGDPRVSKGYFVGGLGFTEGLGRSKGQGRRESYRARPFNRTQAQEPPSALNNCADGG
jgi:hypothetical protein